MNQEISFTLIVLNQQGKPQFILEPRPQPAAEKVQPTRENDDMSMSESIQRQPQHVGGVTLGQIMQKERQS